MKIQEALQFIIPSIIEFYKAYYRIRYNSHIEIKHANELYNDMYDRMYNGFVTSFSTDEVHDVEILNDINPYHATYNKLSCDNNILETLVTYVEDYLIRFRISMSYDNIIVVLNNDIPFDNGLVISYGWIKSIIDIYR